MERIKAKKNGFGKRNRNRLIFYCAFLSLPVLQFCIFYIGVNFNSLLLAFKSYEYETGAYQWVGFMNFKEVFRDFGSVLYLQASIRNSLMLYAFTMLTTFLALLFSYYIFKRAPLSRLFQTMLFIPNIISAIVMVTIFKYFVERAIPFAWEKLMGETVQGLLGNQKTTLGTLIFYCCWSGFGVQMLMYSGAMSGVSDSVIEAAKLDGITPIREFFYIIVPLIYPTLVTFLVVEVAGIFTNQMKLYNFYGLKAEYSLYTFGYFLYKEIQSVNISGYPYLAAMGLVLTAVAVPLTLIVRKVLETVGPKV